MSSAIAEEEPYEADYESNQAVSMEQAQSAVSEFDIAETIEEVKEPDAKPEKNAKHVGIKQLKVEPGMSQVKTFSVMDSPFTERADKEMKRRKLFETLEPDNDVQSDDETIRIAKLSLKLEFKCSIERYSKGDDLDKRLFVYNERHNEKNTF